MTGAAWTPTRDVRDGMVITWDGQPRRVAGKRRGTLAPAMADGLKGTGVAVDPADVWTLYLTGGVTLYLLGGVLLPVVSGWPS